MNRICAYQISSKQPFTREKEREKQQQQQAKPIEQTSNKMISSIGNNLLIIRATVCCLIALNQLMVTKTINAQTDQQPAFLPSSSSLLAAALHNSIIANGNANLQRQQSLASSSSASSLSSMPGHYEFEVAPKMEPPSVRRPPYQQSSTQICPGSDPFAAFSPKDTLCGNLNEGRVPINPLGQNINDQSYPFELIKNKTLQFLARALPVLKLEYETIPKVARYLPGQHLLNPTHMSSPLGHEHFHRINQQLAPNFSPASNPYLASMQSQSGGAGRRRRRRSLAQASYTVAELSPNTSLLVSSAHSAPGRIRDFMGHQPDAASPTSQLAVITKDGYRPMPQVSTSFRPFSSSNSTVAPKLSVPGEQSNNSTTRQSPSSSSPSLSSPPQPTQHQQQHQHQHQQLQHQQQQQQQQQNKVGGPTIETQRQRQVAAGNTPASVQQPITTAAPSSPSSSAAAGGGNSQQQQQQQQQQQRNHAKATTADSGQGATSTSAAALATQVTAEHQHQQQAQLTKQHSANGNNSTKDQTPAWSPSSSGLSKRRSLVGCSDSTNGFSSAICQAAMALIEGSERQPAWIQVMKHLGNALVGPTDSTQAAATASPMAQNNPVWSLLSGLSAVSQAYNGFSNEAQSKSAGSGQQSSNKPNFMNLIGPIASMLTSSGNGGINRSGLSKESSNSSSEGSSNKAADLASQSSLSSALANGLGSSTLAKLALAGWASNAVAGLLDYFAPSLFTSAARGFARRKKPYDPSEQFVDTPASLAALTAAATSSQQQSRQASGFGVSPSKQPPTPCPSVEEYISPTFARNYQGTWKYVIQIPHEGYFTQTIQRTSCVRQRCEFTDGVCHESPRWVSLLVAEIYYPHAVFSQSPGVGSGGGIDQAAANSLLMQQQAALSASPSMSSIQQVQPAQQQQRGQQPQRGQGSSAQDPLQMTDSLHNYNHNLNSAFLEASEGLTIDPSNLASMQQLANSFSYPLFQRNGLLPNQQYPNQQMESRSSSTPNSNPLLGQQQQQQQYSVQPPVNQPQQQQKQQQQPQQQHQQQSANLAYQEYIHSLAAATLQQNPHMTPQDLINSLQQSLSRKKRDLPANGAGENSWSPQMPGHRIQQRSGASTSGNQQQSVDQSIVNHPALNEIPSGGLTNQQQQPYGKPNSVLMDTSSAQSQLLDSSAATNAAAATNLPPSQTGSGESASAADQTECDGHDKIGCYVVRVYYDWFLVNGSCKCWKTTSGQSGQSGSQQQQSGNSFIRRIFTG